MSKIATIYRKSGDPANAERFGHYLIESLVSEEEEGVGTIYRVRIDPHTETHISYHLQAEEYYFVLSGHGTAIIDGKPLRLVPGHFLRLPPGTRHGFVTEKEPLEMLDIHTPGCRPGRDVYLEEADEVAEA